MMSSEFFLFWALLLLAVELATAATLAYALASGLALLLLLLGFLFSGELDLLASVLLALYSSVFVFLSLLALHFGPYGMPAAAVTRAAGSLRGSAVLMLACLCVLLLSWQVAEPALWALGGCLPWLSLYAEQRGLAALQVAVVHWLFYRVFTLEACWLNLYLLLGLALAVALLGLLRVGGATAPGGGWRATASARIAGFPVNRRIRLVASLRRQVRRKNASISRF